MKLIADTTNVVIGSGSLLEAKFQILNFMGMLYNVIVEDKDYSYYGYSNLRPWSHNLKYEINNACKKDEQNTHDVVDIMADIDFIENKLSKAKDIELISAKKKALNTWEKLLKKLTKEFDLKYEKH